MRPSKVYDIDDWCEHYGDVLLLHFDSFSEPPIVLVSSPMDCVFHAYGVGYWTHFIIHEWNDVFEQAIKINDRNAHGVNGVKL